MENIIKKILLISFLFVLFLYQFSYCWTTTGKHYLKGTFPTYRVNENGTPDCAGEFTAIQNATQTWNAVTTTYIDFNYGNTTTTTALAWDGVSLVRWVESGWINYFPEYPGRLAVNSNWYSGTTYLESDIFFNGQDFTWSDNGQGCDVQAVATHEIGHSVGLDHSSITNSIMYANNQNYRTLRQDDIDGARYVNFEAQTSGTLNENQVWALNLNSNTINLAGNINNSSYSLNIKSGITVNLGSFYIYSTGGTLTVESGATINNCVYLKQNGVLKGLFPSINSALSNTVSGQIVEVRNSQTLTGNATIPSGVTLSFLAGSSLNFNNYGIFGGTLTIDPTVHLNEVYFGGGFYHVQTAINNASNGQTVTLLSKTYNTNISFSNKNNVDLSGTGTSSSIINGTITVTNCQYVDVNNLKAKRLTINGGLNNFTNNIMLENPGVDVLSIYNCPSQTITYSSIMDSYEVGAYINNSIGSFEHCNIEGHSTGLYFYNSSSFNVDNSYMCGNYPYDMDALAPAIAHCHTNTYSNVPTSSCHGNVIIMGTSNICMVLKANAERSVAINNNPSWKEFVSIDSVLMDIRSRVNEKVKNKDFGIDDFIPEYNAVIANLNGLMQRTSDASIIKTIIFRLSQCYQLMNKTNELKSFVDKLLGIKKMEDYSPYIKRHLMPYYIDQKDYSSALAIADEIIKVASSDEDLLCEMLYEKALIYKYSLNELERADAFFNEIVNKYPENIMTRFANSELGKKNSSERNVIKPNDEIVVSHKNDLDINNYPNPFNPTTTISFTLPSDGRVTIKVYDMLGREVKTLVNDFKSTGSYSIIWDSKDNYSNEVSSGIYFYNIKFKDNSVTKKMLLVR